MTGNRPGRLSNLRPHRVCAGLALLGSLLFGAPAAAQGLMGLQSGDQPLEINAEEGIEWRRNEQLYIARGNAEAIRGELTLYADVMTAHYSKTEAGDTDIDRIDVEGNVRIVSPTQTVYGDRGAYDVSNGVLVLVGDDLRLVGENDIITARDSLEYWELKNMAVARGDAVAVRDDKRIQADVLSAHFAPDAEDNLALTRIDAFGNVRIATATDFARGDRGVYYVDREFATLSGAVKITREENQMNGEYAEINMKTGVSRLLAGAPGTKTTTRVRGLLVPKRKPKSGAGS
ncbi:MAG: LptA/OstA family protein [Alphaproteobacteria bacterium]